MELKAMFAAAGTAAALLMGAANAAPLIIDNFDDLSSVDSDPTTVGVDASDTVVNGNFLGAAGRSRTLSVVNLTSPGTGGTGATIGLGSPSVLDIDNGSQERGLISVDYDFNAAIDLSDGGSNDTFLVDFDFTDFSQTVTVTFTDTSGSTSVMKNSGALILPGDDGSLAFAFMEFAGIDFANIIGLSLDFESTQRAADATVDFIVTSSEIPLPAGAPLILSGLAGFAAFRRMRKN